MYSLTETFQRCKVIPGKPASAAEKGPDTSSPFILPGVNGGVWGSKDERHPLPPQLPRAPLATGGMMRQELGPWGPEGALEDSEGAQGEEGGRGQQGCLPQIAP